MAGRVSGLPWSHASRWRARSAPSGATTAPSPGAPASHLVTFGHIWSGPSEARERGSRASASGSTHSVTFSHIRSHYALIIPLEDSTLLPNFYGRRKSARAARRVR
eukprot:1188562-Prorocentrum_minimum.AAC.1